MENLQKFQQKARRSTIHFNHYDVNRFKKFLKNTEPFFQLKYSDIEIEPFDCEPIEGYEPNKNYPNCCSGHQKLAQYSKEWFKKFPQCCDDHKELSKKYWFKKSKYKNVVSKILKNVSYTEYFIEQAINKKSWYIDIINYIEYCIDSFGEPAIGVDRYLGFIKLVIKEGCSNTKREKLLKYFNEGKVDTKEVNNLDFNKMYSAYMEWLDSFPDLPYFNQIKSNLSRGIPINLFFKDTRTNPYSKYTKSSILNNEDLSNILIKLTKNLLIHTTKNKLSENNINLKGYGSTLLAEEHKKKQTKLFEENTNTTKYKYLDMIERWLRAEKEYINELVPRIKNYKKILNFDTKAEELKSYKTIISTINNIGISRERFTRLHNLDEEGFRDAFWSNLENIFEGVSITGETYNKKGKPDIIIESMNTDHKFIIECKLWKGEELLLDALDQLLKLYTDWRTTQVALIVFNKKNKDFTSIVKKAKEKVKEHTLYLNYENDTNETSFSYTFRNNEDKDKKIKLELMMFNYNQ